MHTLLRIPDPILTDRLIRTWRFPNLNDGTPRRFEIQILRRTFAHRTLCVANLALRKNTGRHAP